MNTYFALLNRPSRYSLMVVDDDVDVYRVVQNAPWQLVTVEQVVDAYNKSTGVTSVLLLDSSIVLESGTSVSVLEWVDGYRLAAAPEDRRVLVLYSGEPFANNAFYRSYAKSGNASRDLDEIVRLLETEVPLTEWPLTLPEPVNDLSRAIHALQNLFQPVGWDAEKLRELVESPDPTMLADIFRDHFSAGGFAYLGSQSKCHDGGEVLQRVNALCDSLGQGVHAEVEEKIRSLAERVRAARKAFETRGGHPSDEIAPPSAAELCNHLHNIALAGDVLLRALRDIRRREQEKPK